LGKDNFLYLKLYSDIKEKIDAHIYEEGTRIPSDDELKKMFGVSMITVKKALSILKDDNLIQRIPGVGTFVRNQNLDSSDKEETKPSIYRKIGLVMEHVSSAFGLDLLYGIDQQAEKNGYKVTTRFSYFNREKETEEIDFLIQSGIEGLIIMPCHGIYYNPKLLKLILEGFPVVVIDKKLDGILVTSVCTDNKQAIKTLVKTLYDKGCRNIGFVSAHIIGTSSLHERRLGFYEATEEFAINSVSECTLIFDENIYQHDPLEENITLATSYFEKYGEKLDGIICSEYSFMSALTEAMNRSKIPLNSINICCVDGSQELKTPHMKQDEVKMAEKIIELLLKQITFENTDTDIVIPALLIN